MMGTAGFVVALMMIVVIVSPCVYGKGSSTRQEIDVQRLLKRFNKPALKSIKVCGMQMLYMHKLHALNIRGRPKTS